jgi:hypothetical protein
MVQAHERRHADELRATLVAEVGTPVALTHGAQRRRERAMGAVRYSARRADRSLRATRRVRR